MVRAPGNRTCVDSPGLRISVLFASLLVLLVLTGAGPLAAQSSAIADGAAQNASPIEPTPQPLSIPHPAKDGLGPLPPPPEGTTTVIGGVIRDVDPVLDILTLKIPGGKDTKIFFDQRTQAYRDGTEIPLQSLKPGEPASVETLLDGTRVFAASIHTLSQAPTGEFQGQILDYDPSKRELKIRSSLSGRPIRLLVPPGTSIVRTQTAAASSGSSPSGSQASNQAAGTSDLSEGALVSATFVSGHGDHGIAQSIRILAMPGATFRFQGSISYLDLARGILDIRDVRNNHNYTIHFDAAAMPVSSRLHVGEDAVVTARLEGQRYLAVTIDVAAPAVP